MAVPWYPAAVCCRHTLNLHVTLATGQCFRWRQFGGDGATWRGCVGEHLVDVRLTPPSAAAPPPSSLPMDCCSECTTAGTALVLQVAPLASLAFKHTAAEAAATDVVAPAVAAYFRFDSTVVSEWAAWLGQGRKRHPLQKMLEDGAVAWNAADASSREAVADGLGSERDTRPFGFRLLRQPPCEVLFSFLCSQNNNVRRIETMVEHLAAAAGPPLPPHPAADLEGTPIVAHVFPSAAELSAALTEQALKDARFGYRASYIVDTAAAIAAKDRELQETASKPTNAAKAKKTKGETDEGRSEDKDALEAPVDLKQAFFGHTVLGERTSLSSPWCRSVGALDISAARAALVALKGVGRKVADCVLLFGFGRQELVPVDTHVAQTALEAGVLKRPTERSKRGRGEDDAQSLAAAAKKALTPAAHDTVQTAFGDVFGERAGWAHCYLFVTRVSTGLKARQSFPKKPEPKEAAAKKPARKKAAKERE